MIKRHSSSDTFLTGNGGIIQFAEIVLPRGDVRVISSIFYWARQHGLKKFQILWRPYIYMCFRSVMTGCIDVTSLKQLYRIITVGSCLGTKNVFSSFFVNDKSLLSPVTSN